MCYSNNVEPNFCPDLQLYNQSNGGMLQLCCPFVIQTSLQHKRNRGYLDCSHNFEASLLSKISKWYSSLEIYLTNVILEAVTCNLWCKSQFLLPFMKLLHACILSTSKKEISANKNKTFYFKTLDISKWMYWDVQTGFQIKLVACRHTVPCDKLLFLPYFA